MCITSITSELHRNQFRSQIYSLCSFPAHCTSQRSRREWQVGLRKEGFRERGTLVDLELLELVVVLEEVHLGRLDLGVRRCRCRRHHETCDAAEDITDGLEAR
jgi:hypothetical protein